MAKRFNDEEMTSDPEPKAPSFVSKEEDKPSNAQPTPADRAGKWFDTNKVTRVPLIALDKDPYQVENQCWVCFSVIKPEEYGKLKHGEKEYHGFLIKFRGCFPTKELAAAHIHRLMKVDRHFDIHLIPAFQWSCIDDDCVEDREYADDRISDIMKGYFKSENDRMLGIRDRIKQVEDGKKDRSEEATKFFEDATAERALIEDVQEIAEPVTLEQLAKDLDLNAGASVLSFHGGLQKEKQDAVVSEIILEE